MSRAPAHKTGAMIERRAPVSASAAHLTSRDTPAHIHPDRWIHRIGAAHGARALGISPPRPSTTQYHSPVQVATGTVVGGKVVVEGLDLAEGEIVTVLTREREIEVHLSPEEETELLAAIAEADRGETISPEELFARLDRIR